MSWLTKGILLASQEIKSAGLSKDRGPRHKEFGNKECGKRMSETWGKLIVRNVLMIQVLVNYSSVLTKIREKVEIYLQTKSGRIGARGSRHPGLRDR